MLLEFCRYQKASYCQSDHARKWFLLDDDAHKVPISETDRSVEGFKLVLFYSVTLLDEKADLGTRVVADSTREFTYIIPDFEVHFELS